MELVVDTEGNTIRLHCKDTGSIRYVYIIIDNRWFMDKRPDCARMIELLFGEV